MLLNIFIGVFWSGVFLYLFTQVKEKIEGVQKVSSKRQLIERYYSQQEKFFLNYKSSEIVQSPFHSLLYNYYVQYDFYLKNNISLTNEEATWINENANVKGVYIQLDYWQNWTNERLIKEVKLRITQLENITQNVLFENSNQIILVQNNTVVGHVDIKNWKKLHEMLIQFVKKMTS